MKESIEAHDMAAKENEAIRKSGFLLVCSECKQTLSKVFCSCCDEFYNDGHKTDCSQYLDRGVDHNKCADRQ